MVRKLGFRYSGSTSLLLCAVTCSCSLHGERTSPPQDLPVLAAHRKVSPPALKAERVEPKPPKAPRAPADLVTSTDDITKLLGFSSKQKRMLLRQGLAVTRAPDEFGKIPERIYDRIYQRDLPVLITSDSILYAFHRQYMNFLEELETTQLTALLHQSVSRTRKGLLQATTQSQIDAKTAQELDVYLTVALSLLISPTRPILDGTPLRRVQSIVQDVEKEQPAKLKLFDDNEVGIDYSHFKPRGHYTHSEELERYFRCVMWLGRIALTIQSYPNRKPKLDRKNFNTAATLSWLIHQSGAEKGFTSYQRVLDTFVGPGDDDTPLPIIAFLKSQRVNKISKIRKLPNRTIKKWLRVHAKQRSRIATQPYLNQSQVPRKPTPRNFMMIGQRFTLDSKVLASLVYDQLVHPQSPKTAVLRKLPKTLDIIAALGNPRAKVHLQEEFQRYPYEPALDSIVNGLGSLPDKAWTKNLHSAWLAAIASLHQSPDDPKLPAVFRTTAWKDKTLQTQLASWAELRHDHILYVKQSVSGSIGCEFPDAYVEPVPHFYARVNRLVAIQKSAIDLVEEEGLRVDGKVHKRLDRFTQVLEKLEKIAQKELAHEPLQDDEKHFLKQAVEHETQGYGPVRWDGWYPEIIGKGPVGTFEPTIADVHTDPPDVTNGGVAQILHAGTGAFEMATVLVDCPGNKKCPYVGPISSFYELVPPKGQRLTDEDWELLLRTREGRQARPSWIKSFRAPDELIPFEIEEEDRARQLIDQPSEDDDEPHEEEEQQESVYEDEGKRTLEEKLF